MSGYPISWVPAASGNFAVGRNGHVPGWLVHHRMVGYLTGTDRHFQRPGVQTSTHFGVGHRVPGGPVHISQYVALDDRAFGNGNNVDAAGDEVDSAWNRNGFPSRPNEHTISIEHEDGASANRGVVEPDIIEASIWLDRLLLTGDPARLRNAGVRFRSEALVRALARLPIDEDHVIDHHYIAGPLKPFCWRPWLDDDGFPQARYLAALSGGDMAIATPGSGQTKPFTGYEIALSQGRDFFNDAACTDRRGELSMNVTVPYGGPVYGADSRLVCIRTRQGLGEGADPRWTWVYVVENAGTPVPVEPPPPPPAPDCDELVELAIAEDRARATIVWPEDDPGAPITEDPI